MANSIALALLVGGVGCSPRREAVVERWELGKRWEPGHSFADSSGTVHLVKLLPCTRDEETGRLTPSEKASAEEITDIRAYNQALGKVQFFSGPLPESLTTVIDFDDVMTALLTAQELSVKGNNSGASTLLRRVMETGMVGHDPLASVISADLAIHVHGDFDWGKRRLKLAAEAHPRNKWLWLSYASKSELGSIPMGKKFDPLAPPFTYEDSVIARKYILKMWPDHYKSLYHLAQDLDWLGRKKEALQVLKKFESVQLTDAELIQERVWLRRYFDKGGFKRNE